MLCGLTPPSAGAGRPCSACRSPTAQSGPPRRRPDRRRPRSIPAAAAARRSRSQPSCSASTAARVDELLELVGLDERAARKRVGQYSLGMRQRLGIAHALLGDPQVLILDEPANGLDPEGMRWMRGLLRDFAARGGTVLLSSHLLHEVRGDRRPSGHHRRRPDRRPRARSEDLLARHVDDPRPRGRRDAAWRAALDRAGIRLTAAADGGIHADAEPEAVGRAALRAGVALRELRADGDGGLEQLFFSLTADDETDIPGDRTMSAIAATSGPRSRRRCGRSPPRHRATRRRRAAQDGRHPRRLLAADWGRHDHRDRGDRPR